MHYEPLFTSWSDRRRDNWDRACRFIDFWHQPLDVEDGVTDEEIAATESRLGISLPAAVCEWHIQAGKKINQWCGRAETHLLDELSIEGEALVLRTETLLLGKLVIPWAIRLDEVDQDDPPVWTMWQHSEPKPCVEKYSHFAIDCLVLDTVNAHLFRQQDAENDVPFPEGGVRMDFPDSFGMITTEIHEGENWIALVSGNDWYLRRRDPDNGETRLIKHEIRE